MPEGNHQPYMKREKKYLFDLKGTDETDVCSIQAGKCLGGRLRVDYVRFFGRVCLVCPFQIKKVFFSLFM